MSEQQNPPADPAPKAKATFPKPSLGRIVHFVLPDDSPRKGQHRAAILTSSHTSDCQNMAVFLDQIDDLPECTVFHPFSRAWSASHDEETKAPGTWHWPEKV